MPRFTKLWGMLLLVGGLTFALANTAAKLLHHNPSSDELALIDEGDYSTEYITVSSSSTFQMPWSFTTGAVVAAVFGLLLIWISNRQSLTGEN